jgi:hypothetical protein
MVVITPTVERGVFVKTHLLRVNEMANLLTVVNADLDTFFLMCQAVVKNMIPVATKLQMQKKIAKQLLLLENVSMKAPPPTALTVTVRPVMSRVTQTLGTKTMKMMKAIIAAKLITASTITTAMSFCMRVILLLTICASTRLAVILATVDLATSSKKTEQILGRVKRLNHAMMRPKVIAQPQMYGER